MDITFIDHTADVLFEVNHAENFYGVLQGSALALAQTQVDISKIILNKKKSFKIKKQSLGMVLYDFLDELIYFKDTERLIFIKFDFSEDEKNYFISAQGGLLSEGMLVDVKAVTFHELKVTETYARVLLDI